MTQRCGALATKMTTRTKASTRPNDPLSFRGARGLAVLGLALGACRHPAAPPAPDDAGVGTSPSARQAAPAGPPAAVANASSSQRAGRDEPSGPRLLSLGFTFTEVHAEPRFEWRLVDKRSWQASSESLPALAPERPLQPSRCPDGMILVQGRYLADTRGRDDSDEVLLAQNEACTRWLTGDRGLNGLCTRFDPGKWQRAQARFPRAELSYCIDRYEFPNAWGEFPLVVVTFSEASEDCRRAGKRVCTEQEWTFACEGEEGRPFPYGWERDANACNIDVLRPGPPDDTFKPRFTEHTARGVDMAWQGRRSGESPSCSSPFGVQDMTGNVDEWTQSVRRYGYQMILKGGHWGAGRHRCRPQTRGHGPRYLRYDAGFRCCADVSAERAVQPAAR